MEDNVLIGYIFIINCKIGMEIESECKEGKDKKKVEERERGKVKRKKRENELSEK